jgi:hypothetical protein
MSKVIVEVFRYELVMVHSVEIRHATVAFVFSVLTPFYPDLHVLLPKATVGTFLNRKLQPVSARETLNVSIKTVLE